MFVLSAVLLLIRSIISIEIDENAELSYGYNNRFLKTDLPINCTFSIGLGDMATNGWFGGYVTVNIGQESSQYTRINQDTNPVWFNFQVQSGS